MKISEYDAFGPWIIDVEQPDDVPRLFHDFPIDFERALLVFKVPRNIARRDANPSMHLYDVLVIAESDGLTVLRRDSESTYNVIRVVLATVYAVEDSVSLLDGRLLLHSTEHEPILIEYNGSSHSSVSRLVSLVRDLIVPSSGSAVAGDSRDEAAAISSLLVGEADYGLRGDSIAIVASEPAAHVVGGHSTMPIHPSRGGMTKLTHTFRPAVLQGAVAIEVPSAVLILRRRDPIVRGRHDDLSHSFTVVFLDRVTATTQRPHPLYPEVAVLEVRAGSSSLEVLIPSDGRFRLPLAASTKA